MEESIAEAGLKEVETYICHSHNTVTQFITTRPIMDLVLAALCRPGSRVANQWWEKEGLDFEGMRTVAQEAEKTDGG